MCVLYPLTLSGCVASSQHLAPTPIAHRAPAANEGVAPAPQIFVSPYTYEHFVRAELARAQGDYRGAVEGYRRALAGADEDVLVIARLALALDALGDHDAAHEWLDHGMEIDSQSEALWLARGEIAERHEDRAAAIASYEQAEAFAPMSQEPVLALARVLANVPERAQAVLKRYAQRHSRWSPRRLHVELMLALEAKDLTAALAAFDALRTIVTPSPMQTEAIARLALEADRSWLAREVLGAPSERIVDHQLWLRVLIAARDFDNARLVLAMSTPEQVGGLVALAAAYLAVGERARALELAQLAAQSDPHGAALVALEAADQHALAQEARVHARPRP